MSREHYVSLALLRLLAGDDGNVIVGGYHWQPERTMQRRGISSLTAKILCEHHNSQLSSLDAVGAALWSATSAIVTTPDRPPSFARISGPLVERWFLKVIVGSYIASRGDPVPEMWKDLLLGAPWPTGWGLYAWTRADEPRLHRTEFSFVPIVDPHDERTLLAVHFSMAGPVLVLSMSDAGAEGGWTRHHPGRLVFDHGDVSHAIEFTWPHGAGDDVVYVRGPRVADQAPDWAMAWPDDV